MIDVSIFPSTSADFFVFVYLGGLRPFYFAQPMEFFLKEIYLTLDFFCRVFQLVRNFSLFILLKRDF